MHEIVIDAIASIVDVIGSVENLLNCRPIVHDDRNAIECFHRYVIQLLVGRGRWRAKGKGWQDLPGVARYELSDGLSDQHVALMQNSIGVILCRNTDAWITHRCGRHVVNVVLSTKSEVRCFHNRRQLMFGKARTGFSFQRLDGPVAELCPQTQEFDLFLTLHEAELTIRDGEINECCLWEQLPYRLFILIGEFAYETNFGPGQPSLLHALSGRRNEVRAAPSHVCNASYLASVWNMIV